MSLTGDVQCEASYYNENLSVWEPLLEPVEVEKGTQRLWEVNVKVCCDWDIYLLTILLLSETLCIVSLCVNIDKLCVIHFSWTQYIQILHLLPADGQEASAGSGSDWWWWETTVLIGVGFCATTADHPHKNLTPAHQNTSGCKYLSWLILVSNGFRHSCKMAPFLWM